MAQWNGKISGRSGGSSMPGNELFGRAVRDRDDARLDRLGGKMLHAVDSGRSYRWIAHEPGISENAVPTPPNGISQAPDKSQSGE